MATTHWRNAALTLALALPLALAAPVLAQDRPDPKAEVARLEKLLAEVEGALEKLRKVNQPEQRWEEYDLRALFRSAPDRAAPSLDLSTPDAGNQTAAGGAAAGGSLSFDDAEEYDYGLEPDYLVDMLERAFLERHPRDVRVVGGYLQLRTTEPNHAIARSLIERLRRERLRCVQVEVGIYSLPEALQTELEKTALEKGGALDPAALKRLDQAVAQGQGKLVDAALLSSLGGQAVYFHRGSERSYVASFERSSGGTGQIVDTVSDPIVDVLRTGLALEVRPKVLEGDRIQVDLRCARADLLGITRRASPYGAIDVPRLELTSTATSLRVPKGSGLLVTSTRKAAAKKDDEAKPKSVLIVVRPR